MELIVCKDYQEVSKVAASIVIKEMVLKPDLHLGLATGSSPLGLYTNLIQAYQNQIVSFKDVKTFNLDEYIGIKKSHPESYYSFMQKNLFRHVDINLGNVHIPENDITKLDEIPNEYNLLLENNPIDIQVLGIGSNGHIGFNEPGTPLKNETFIVDLDEQTREDNARFFGSIDEVPSKAITMGIKNIMRSKKIVLIASGENKAKAVKEAIYGDVTNHLPASVLQLHPNCIFVIDEAASKLIEN